MTYERFEEKLMEVLSDGREHTTREISMSTKDLQRTILTVSYLTKIGKIIKTENGYKRG